MTKFVDLNDHEIIAYLIAHFDELEVGPPDPDLERRLAEGVRTGSLSIERDDVGFAIVARANRRHPGLAGNFFPIQPEADLMFLYISPMHRGQRTGTALLARVQEKFMEDQAMIAVCAGDRRKRFFERAGFRHAGTTHEGLNLMVCPARAEAK